MVELLAPAGDLERLKVAFNYGADACYIGGMEYGLRKAATNFTRDDLKEAVTFAHDKDKKVYVTLNIIPHENDLVNLDDYIKFLDDIKVDAVIVSDPGIFNDVKRNSNLEIHISTQGSVTNSKTANFWYELGARRIVLARELSLEEIKKIKSRIPEDLELEAFCHGAMCMSYSGRCLISNYMTGRDANAGECSHPCRYKYYLVEEKRPGEYFPIEEVDGGTYLMNSKDLSTISFVDKLVEAGISSLKIEGRVKSAFYIASVVRAYRKVLDCYLQDKENYEFDKKMGKEILMSSHRPFTSGFYFGNPGVDGQYNNANAAIPKAVFKGEVLNYKDQRVYIKLKNGLNQGDVVEIIGPSYQKTRAVEDLRNEDGKNVERANVPQSTYSFIWEDELAPGYYVRKAD